MSIYEYNESEHMRMEREDAYADVQKAGMYVDIDGAQLLPLIRAFYDLSGIKIAIYDNQFEEVLTYPQNDGEFCSLMHENKRLWEKCEACTKRLCEKCAHTGKIIIYRCHAGLTEVVAPLTDCGVTVGYVVYGQITDEPDHSLFVEGVVQQCEKYGMDPGEVRRRLANIRYYSREQLESTRQIVEALISYIMMKNWIHIADKPVELQLLEYIEKNLNKDLSVETLCKKFALSKSKLYDCVKNWMPEGIAKYVRRRRMQAARQDILLHPEKPLWMVARDVGFENYEYFMRVFKAETGISVRSLKSTEKEERK